jgi:hypothetical protein
VFGLGLLCGLFVLAFELKSLARVASGLMALGIAGDPGRYGCGLAARYQSRGGHDEAG